MTLRDLTIFSFFLLLAKCQDPEESQHTEELLTVAQRWGFGMLTALGVSLLGFFAAIVLLVVGKTTSSDNFKAVVRVLFALSCGTLIGDSMIHIMAEAYANPEAEPFIVSGVFIGSLLIFMMLDKAMALCGVTHNHWVEEHHHHDHPENQNKAEQPSTEMIRVQPCDQNAKPTDKPSNQMVNDSKSPAETPATNEDDKNKDQSCLSKWKGKGSAGYLNLLGSLIHNFVDGLTIGLAFATGDKHYYTPILIAVFAHQIPRELGDVAVLLESKFLPMQALLSNGIINLISLVGAIIGLSTVGVSELGKIYVMVFVAGNFIYISADIWRHLFTAKWLQNTFQFLFFGIGVGAMYGIKFLEPAEH